MSSNQPKNHDGFTLIELLIVLVIIAIASTLGLTYLGKYYQTRQLESLCQTLSNQITYAQNQAILQQQIIKLTINQHHYQFDQYQITAANTSENKNKTNWVKPTQTALITKTIPNSITFSTTLKDTKKHSILFLPSGILSQKLSLKISNKNKKYCLIHASIGGEQKAIKVRTLETN